MADSSRQPRKQMFEHTDPNKEPFKVGQLVRIFLQPKRGLFLVLEITWDSYNYLWWVKGFSQTSGKNEHLLAYRLVIVKKIDE